MSSQPELTLKISAVIESDEGSFHGYCPALKGLHVDGATEDETLKNLMDAIEVRIASLAQCGDPLPIGPDLTVDAETQIPKAATLRNLTLRKRPSIPIAFTP